MFHKNPCTENVSKCENPNLCTVSNIHAASRSQASKYYAQSEKKLENIEKLSKTDVETILERKKLELPYVAEHIDSTMKNYDNVVLSQGEDSNAANHLRNKLEGYADLLKKIDDDITFLEVRWSELS